MKMMLFDPTWVQASNRGIMQQKGGPEENRLILSSDKVAGRSGWHSREIKPEESEHTEGQVALRRGTVT
jgi:hypothetical protein